MYSQHKVNRISVIRESKEFLLEASDKDALKKHFAVNIDYNDEKRKFSQLMLDTLCTKSCTLINWVCKKTKGELEEDNTNTCHHIYNNEQKICKL